MKGLGGVMKEQEKQSILHDKTLGLYHCSYHFPPGIYNIFSFVLVKYIITPSWVEIKVGRLPGYDTAFHPFAKTNPDFG